jgi:hypothetical protein
MKKIIYLGWLIVFLPAMVFAQEKVEAPVWNVGDKWVFTQGNIEVVDADQNSYTLKYSKDTCVLENKQLEKIIFDKSTLNRIYTLKAGKREQYTLGLKRILNFPINLGNEWNDTLTATSLSAQSKGETRNYAEAFKVLGWENVQVQAGNFKAIKLEYFQKSFSTGRSGKEIYWYAPEVKYFLKCQYDTNYRRGEVADWELVSFKLKK